LPFTPGCTLAVALSAEVATCDETTAEYATTVELSGAADAPQITIARRSAAAKRTMNPSTDVFKRDRLSLPDVTKHIVVRVA
jgi:hypothetical protein